MWGWDRGKIHISDFLRIARSVLPNAETYGVRHLSLRQVASYEAQGSEVGNNDHATGVF